MKTLTEANVYAMNEMTTYEEAVNFLDGLGLQVDPKTGEIDYSPGFDPARFGIGLGVTSASPIVIWLGWTIRDWFVGRKMGEVGGIITMLVGTAMLGGGMWAIATSF